MTFTQKLKASVTATKSTVCVGLDPNLDLLPQAVLRQDLSEAEKVEHFLKKVIDVTQTHCAAYKPNLGFFEALGADGWDTFQAILDYIPDDKIIIADAKRGDISSTAEHYAKAFFEHFDADAVTLNPLMGFETLDPFLKDDSKCIYVLTLTSNPGAEDILLQKLENGDTISSYVSTCLQEKQKASKTSIGMVVGATQAKDIQPVINNFKNAHLLIPGIGKQGGDIQALAEALEEHRGIPLINSSRSIIYAGRNSENWSEEVGKASLNLKKKLSAITQRYVQ
ncbi:MAG TPA: orotidine-5'-phosphate decarboxylase [Balneolaceae bacterium]|nr:orotidine-5'-phosphate decarboxylase [Balneolaceae bacterium]